LIIFALLQEIIVIYPQAKLAANKINIRKNQICSEIYKNIIPVRCLSTRLSLDALYKFPQTM